MTIRLLISIDIHLLDLIFVLSLYILRQATYQEEASLVHLTAPWSSHHHDEHCTIYAGARSLEQ